MKVELLVFLQDAKLIKGIDNNLVFLALKRWLFVYFSNMIGKQ